MVEIGIMQGRLSPPVGDRIQAFPVETWEWEFELARTAGLDGIEWIFEHPPGGSNPLTDEDGRARIRHISAKHGIPILSVCADEFMQDLLLDLDGRVRTGQADALARLLGAAREVGAHHVVLPFVDESGLQGPAQREGLVSLLDGLGTILDDEGVEIHLEMDLAPAAFARLLETVGHPLVKANHDTGNSASLGFEHMTEYAELGEWIGSVHIKDRTRGGPTVPLGAGDARLDERLRELLANGYNGPFILQAARSPGMPEVERAARDRAFVERIVTPGSPDIPASGQQLDGRSR